MHRQPRLTLTVPNKAARRVIAPYVKVIRKKYKAPAVPESKLFKKHLERKPSVLLRDLTSFLSDNVDLPSLLHESADVLKVTTHAHGEYIFNLSHKYILTATFNLRQFLNIHSNILTTFFYRWRKIPPPN